MSDYCRVWHDLDAGHIRQGHAFTGRGRDRQSHHILDGLPKLGSPPNNLDQGQAGDNVGILLRGVERDDIERGQVLAKPGSITPHTEFDSEVYILTKEEGGRHTPFFKGYKPQFYFRTTDVTGEVELPADKEMVMPGDTVTFKVKLLVPIAMDEGLRFAIREGGRTVGAGVVTKITK